MVPYDANMSGGIRANIDIVFTFPMNGPELESSFEQPLAKLTMTRASRNTPIARFTMTMPPPQLIDPTSKCLFDTRCSIPLIVSLDGFGSH